MSNFASYWRTAGLNYLQYLTKCTTAARSVVKQSVKAKYAPREQFHFTRQIWTPELVKKGIAPEKTIISNIAK